MSPEERYRVRATDVLHEGWPPVLRHLIEFPDGRRRQWVEMRLGDGAAVLALTREGRVVLTRQHVVGLDEPAYVLPGGVVEPGETGEDAARRELAEEAGYSAPTLEPLFRYANLPAYSSGSVQLFLCRDAEPIDPTADPVEIIGVELLDIDEAVAMAVAGRFVMSSTAMAMLLLPHVLRSDMRNATMP